MKRHKTGEASLRARIGKRLCIYSLVVLFLFLVAYILDRMIPYNVREGVTEDGSIFYSAYVMYVPMETLVIVFVFLWLIGMAVVVWKSLSENERMQRGGAAPVHSREQLHKLILRRYQRQFFGTLALLTLVMGLVAAMLVLIQISRIWQPTDPLYPPLKMLKELSPALAIALWLGCAALLLYRGWHQSAGDVVGLIRSIEQMQAGAEGIRIDVPETLPEVQPVVQAIYDQAQQDRRAAREAEQRKNELIAYLAHDLKTPLTSVIGYVSLLKEQPDMPTAQRAAYTQIALEKAARLESLIGQFFEISRANADEMILTTARFDLTYLLRQMADEFFPIVEKQNKQIALHAPQALWVEGDAEKLARVFNNILRNAAAYSDPGSTIHIHAGGREDGVEVSIQNTGKPIAEEQLARIFTKFVRLDDARSSDTGGAGLGLAIAREIVLRHGGDIRAESGADTVTIVVTLPKS